MKNALITIGILSLATALGLFWWEQYSLLSLFEFDLVGMGIKNISLKSANISFKLKLTSKSKIEFVVSKISVRIYINGMHIGDAYQEEPQVVPAMGYNYFNIDALIQNKNILSQVLAIAGADPMTPLEVRTVGSCHVKSSFISVSLPFNQTYNTNLHELLVGFLS